MRGMDHQQADMFSYLSPEQRVAKGHPLRAVRAMTDEILNHLSPLFDGMYAAFGRLDFYKYIADRSTVSRQAVKYIAGRR